MMVSQARRSLTIGLIALAGAIAGCGASSLTANSSCGDFLNASREAQDEAVSRLAGELHAPEADTPLGRPNVNYICANNATETLGRAVAHSG
jgi:hypothetical protein